MSTLTNPYQILGVGESASEEEIKKTFRRLAHRLHPDVNPKHPGAAVQFQEINAAYELLTDGNARHNFDTSDSPMREDLEFGLRVTLSKQTIAPLPEPQVIYLLAEIIPDPRAKMMEELRDAKRESRVNLTLVLDRSNSMSGTRLDKVKIAAHQIIDQLNKEDILSVVTFNDWAETIIPATMVKDKATLKARVSMMTASGGTEIYKGLADGVKQNREFLSPRLVNHIILLTDGRTYGDEDECMRLGHEVAEEGISISAMGLGEEWNDKFLDNLASATGGHSSYINNANAVVDFLNDHVRSLSNVFAERIRISIAPDADIDLEDTFRLAPNPQPLAIDQGYTPLGTLQMNRPMSVLFQLQMPPDMPEKVRSVARVAIAGDVLGEEIFEHRVNRDLLIKVADEPQMEDPPVAIIEALSKLTLYRMQEKVQHAMDRGDYDEATRRLQNLATRLFQIGEESLAHQAMSEAKRVSTTHQLSAGAQKELKYQTRGLVNTNFIDPNGTNVIDENKTNYISDNGTGKPSNPAHEEDAQDSEDNGE